MKRLFKDYEVHHKIILFGFSLTFALSCTMFELIIFEILDFLDPNSRLFHWKFGLYFILFLLVFAIPYTISYLIVKTSGFSKLELFPFFSSLLINVFYF